MSTIFLSYRRQDSAGFTKALGEKLAQRFGEDAIFRDLEDIEAGDDFVSAIEDAVSSCRVLLAIIGPHWSNMRNADGQRRLENPNDFVRLEIEAALKRGVPVIPVTVNGANWPPKETLPDSLQPLLTRQAHDLSDRQGRWEYDVDHLLQRLEEISGMHPGKENNQPTSPQKAQRSGWSSGKFAGLGVLVVGVAAASIYLFSDQEKPISPVPDIQVEESAKSNQAVTSTSSRSEQNTKIAAERNIPQPQENTVDRTSRDYYANNKFIDLSGKWRDRRGKEYTIKMHDKASFSITKKDQTGTGTINGKSIRIEIPGGGSGTFRLSNLGNHISGKFHKSGSKKSEDMVLMRIK